MMGHVIARQVDMSPWEALLLAVRRAATWAAFYEYKMSQVEEDNDDALRPGGTHYDWVLAAERVNAQMARYAKMAVDAGVAAMLVSQARDEGMAIARIVNQALGEAGLDEESDRRVREALRRTLLEMDAQRLKVAM